MADRLKIYACSGIGATDKKPIGYWLDGTDTISNTQAVNTLLVKINTARIFANRLQTISKEERIALLNEIDWLSVALDAAKRFKGDNEKLYHAGEVISDMVKNGAFDGDITDLREREERLEELIEKANGLYSDDAIKSNDPEFMQWWKENIMARNKVGLSEQQQEISRKALKKASNQIKGIGEADESWKENKDIAEYLTKGGTYFLYTYFTPKQLAKLPGIFKLKRQKQLRTYNYCLSYFVDVYGSEEDMKNIISASIVDEFGDLPEKVCEDIVSGKRQDIGYLFGAATAAAGIKMLIELLAVISTLLVGIVSAICAMVAQTNVAKYGALDRQVVESSVPNADDYDGLDIGGGTGLGKGSSWLPIAAIAAGLLLLIKR